MTLLVVCLRVVASHGRHDVYAVFAEASRHWQARQDVYHRGPVPYRYSPTVAAVMAPWALVPNPAGGVFWRLTNAAVFLIALAGWARCSCHASSRVALVLLLALPLAVGSLNNGQSNGLVAGLLTGAAVLAVHNRWPLAAAAVAAATLLKVYPISVGLLFVLVGPRRFTVWLGTSLLVGFALPFVLAPPDYAAEQYRAWFASLADDGRELLPREDRYRDVRLLCATCGLELGSQIYSLVQILAALAVAGLCVGARRAGLDQHQLVSLALDLGCLWMTAFGSAAESCTYILLAPLVSLRLVERHRPAWAYGLLWSGYGLLVLSAAASWFPWGRAFHTLGPQPLAALLLLVERVTTTAEFRKFVGLAASLWRARASSGKNARQRLAAKQQPTTRHYRQPINENGPRGCPGAVVGSQPPARAGVGPR